MALAIVLHNIDWKYAEGKYDNLPKITLEHFPLCYLLILADKLQEWDRPGRQSKIRPKDISIEFDHDEKKFKVKMA
ncbi:hypothetical protein KO465_08930 [Candidatus Micrarchaeota archaeon]|nr:hypothetical protein [Candidatus Micrarchaeota archaeon]